MFKFIHAADLHLDSPLRGLSRYESAPVEVIRDACRKAFINLVDFAIQEKVDFVILAGDLYDGDWEDYSTGIFFSLQIGRLNRENIQVFTVAGNHDAANRMTKALEHPANMTMFTYRKPETITLEHLRTVIHGQSFKEQHVYDNLAVEFPPLQKGWFNIGILHTSLDGREGHAPYAPCRVDDLVQKGYQYWALGHVHNKEIVLEDPHIIFPGCVQGRHIRETGAKGCVLVTVNDNRVSSLEEIPLDVLRWAHTTVDLTDAADMRELKERTRSIIEKEITHAQGRPLAMRIRFTGATELAALLATDPHHLEQEVRALGAETVGEELWLEKIELEVSGRLDLDSQISGDGPLSQLLGDILTLTNDPDEIMGLNEILADLRSKTPNEAFGEDSALNLGQSATVERLIKEAKDMLVGKLLTESESK